MTKYTVDVTPEGGTKTTVTVNTGTKTVNTGTANANRIANATRVQSTTTQQSNGSNTAASIIPASIQVNANASPLLESTSELIEVPENSTQQLPAEERTNALPGLQRKKEKVPSKGGSKTRKGGRRTRRKRSTLRKHSTLRKRK